MLVELFSLGVATTGIMTLADDYVKDKRVKKEIEKKWNFLMLSHKNNAQNKINQHYEILDVILKEYGFNAIVSLPTGTSIGDLRKLIPSISIAYGGDVILELSKNKTSAFVRVAIKDLPISKRDEIKFKWYKTFFSGEKCRNNYGETYKIDKVEDMTNPNIKEGDNIVGYRLIVSIPEGMNYDNLLSFENSISKTIGKSFISWNSKTRKAEVEIITKPLSNKEKFVPIKCDPWELYIAMTYSYKPILLNYKRLPNALVGGMTGTGKTVSVIMAFLNLCYFHGRDKVRLVIGLVSDKQDFRVFKNLEQCDYYARSLQDSLKAIRYLTKEASRRNKLFEQCKKFTINIYEYNDRSKKGKLPFIYFMTDEIANYMPLSSDNETTKELKEEFIDLFWKLTREGRSAGIYITVATQRGDTKNLESNIKGNLCNKVSYKFSNTASALTIFGNGDKVATRVTNLDMSERECLIEYIEGITIGKTPYLDTGMMEFYLKSNVVENKEHLKLDINGNVIKEENELEVNQEVKEQEIEENDKVQEAKPKNKPKPKKPRYIKVKDKKKSSNVKRE